VYDSENGNKKRTHQKLKTNEECIITNELLQAMRYDLLYVQQRRLYVKTVIIPFV